MISDQERREAASRLRTQADKLEARNPDGLYTAADLMFRLFDLVGATHAMTLHDVFRFIADLIDRPTCCIRPDVEDEGTIWDLFGTCTCCGAVVDAYSATATASGFLPTRYCPACGAKVVG